jgi:hypothetical protein
MNNRTERIVNRAIKATNRPALYHEIARAALKVDHVRGDELAELIMNICCDNEMRVLMARFADEWFQRSEPARRRADDYYDPEDGISGVAQLVATVMVGTRLAARARRKSQHTRNVTAVPTMKRPARVLKHSKRG